MKKLTLKLLLAIVITGLLFFNHSPQVWAADNYSEIEAPPLTFRCLREAEQYLGSDHPLLVEILYRLANHLSRQNRHAEAEMLLARALDIATKAADTPWNYVRIVERLVKNCYAQGKRQRAITYVENELGFLTRIASTAGKDYQLEWSLLVSLLGQLYLDNHQFINAEELYLMKLNYELSRTDQFLKFDYNHELRIVGALNDLGNLYRVSQRFPQAINYFSRALQREEKILNIICRCKFNLNRAECQTRIENLISGLNGAADRFENWGQPEQANRLRQRANCWTCQL